MNSKQLYVLNNREKVRAANSKWRSDNWLYSSLLRSCNFARKRCLKTGVPHTIGPEDIRFLVQESKGVCQLSGLEFRRTRTPGHVDPFSPSLDRIEPERGYVPGNIRVILHSLNAMKGVGTDEDMAYICRAFLEKHDGQEG